MDKTIFYTPDIGNCLELPRDEALHCVRVLRKKVGDEILLTDGIGFFYDAVLLNADLKHCTVEIRNKSQIWKGWNGFIHIAFAPTKNMDRNEWFVEKATEIGIDRISPIICSHSERKELKKERLEKILISAMKQSQKATVPIIDEPKLLSDFLKGDFSCQRFIAHCYDDDKHLLNDVYRKGEDVLILIGPEGDFSEGEVAESLKMGFVPVSLGNSRLRTETAALVACHTIHILNCK